MTLLNSVDAIPKLTERVQVTENLVWDRWLWAPVIALALVGVLIVATSSMEFSQKTYDNPFSVLTRHGVYLLLAMTAGLVMSLIPIKLWQQANWVFLLIGLGLLTMVLVPGIGHEVNGSKRWIRFGPAGIQPSELMKLFLVMYVSGYLVRRAAEVRSQWSGFLKPILVLAVVIVLLLMEPDFGAVVVTMGAVLGMMFLGGVRASQFFLLVIVCSGAVAAMAFAQPYRVQRLMAFLDPWSADNVFAGGYQLTQALIAIGRGEWFGVGLGNSMLKLFYLPEAHTDFVFAILAEEFGLIGVLIVLTLFSLMIGRMFLIGQMAQAKGLGFGAYACYGFAMIFAIQTLINIGVNTGLLPTKGLTLPLISYGGTSLIICFAMLGFVQGVYHQALHAPMPKDEEGDT